MNGLCDKRSSDRVSAKEYSAAASRIAKSISVYLSFYEKTRSFPFGSPNGFL